MITQNKKILITGGGSGIGFAIAKAFAGKGNQLILAGRNEEKLKAAAAQLPNASWIVCDVTNEKEVDRLVQKIKDNGGLDILVNNAGVASPQNLAEAGGIYEKASYEMDINFLSILRLTEKLLPFLKQSGDAAIVNIQSIVSYIPVAFIATYSATKAALHSYSQSLRLVLQQANTGIKVFEVFPPYVDTDLTKGLPVDKISPKDIADDLISAMEKGEFNVRSGMTNDVYALFHQSPEQAMKTINGVA